MKKNISINISGIIFHIEEDGYETLKKYLDSINRYFSTFEDSSEILADIESRIAEIFLSKLNEEKQVITSEDVSSLVATMGSVSDFKAAEDQETSETTSAIPPIEEPRTESAYTKEQTQRTFTPPKQLMRDQKRKILGGVCAGLGNYFNVDALWIRLLFAILLFAYGFTFFVYIIMWIFVPGSFDLDEPVTGKKMFRDADRKIISGVSGGVAAFLGIDIIAVRVLFIVFTIAGGLGLFVYIVLWLILPVARTLTDKVQMQGEPVTLSNIESTIKKNQNEKIAEDEESTITKILLFPFRLIGMILTGLGRVLGPLLEVIRVAIGIFIVLIGLSLAFGIIVSFGALFGIFSAAALSFPAFNEITEGSVPVDAFLRAFPAWTGVAGFIGTLVPSIFMILLGVSVIAKRIVFSATAGWTLFALFFVSAAMLAVGIPKIVFSFKEEGEYQIENVYKINGKRGLLKINEVGMDDYHAARLTLKGHDAKDFKLVQEFQAKGTTRAKAIQNAKMVDYYVAFQDSVLTFDSNVTFQPDAIFRDQHLDMVLMIPYNFPFVMDEGISRMITQYVDYEDMDNQTWRITEARGLECISCDPIYGENNDENNDRYGLTDFNEVEITGKFDLKIKHGGHYAVELIGPESEKSKYKITRTGETLIIKYEGKRNFRWDLKDLNTEEMRINITMPSLEKLEATGYGSIRFDDFNGEDLDIDTRGPIRIRGEMYVQTLRVNLTGKSDADLSGRATKMFARLELASKLRAYDLEVVNGTVETSGVSSAQVNVSGRLQIEEDVTSEVDYLGSPEVLKRD
jgi:phage shock protein PspC (stress-responsive transcriptional regulator)